MRILRSRAKLALEAHCASNLSKLGRIKKLQAQNVLEACYSADEARFELAEDFTLTRFRGVLLRPLGHSSTYDSRNKIARKRNFSIVNHGANINLWRVETL